MSRGLLAATLVIAGLLASASPLRAVAQSVVAATAPSSATRQPALKASEIRTTIQIDASRGYQVWAPVHAEIAFHVDGEPYTKALVEAGARKDDLDRSIRRSFFSLLPDAEQSFASINKVSWTVDDSGALLLIMDGQTKPFWQKRPGGGRSRVVESSTINLLGRYVRTNEAGSDAPARLIPPGNAEWRVTVLLPKDGRGASVVGDDIQRKIGGHEIRRETTLSGGILTMQASVRALVSEISSAEAKAAEPLLKQLSGDAVTLIVDDALFAESVRQSDILAAESLSAEDDFDKATLLLARKQPALALASIDEALAAGMQGAIVYAMKGDALFALGRKTDARLLYEQALEKKPDTHVNKRIQLGLVRLDVMDNRPRDALVRMDALLAATPPDAFLLLTRAMVRIALADRRGALANVEAGLEIDPSNVELNRLRSRLVNGG